MEDEREIEDIHEIFKNIKKIGNFEMVFMDDYEMIEHIVRHMEYEFPNEGFGRTLDQFMLGECVLVAPVIEKGATKREVKLPKGTWSYLGKTDCEGGQTVMVDAPIDVLPYFFKK